MLKKTVTYEDYNGVEHTEDFYFNLTKVECMELEYGFGADETLSGSIQTLINAGDMATVIKTIKKIVLTSYGIKSPDGKRFIKNDTIRTEFEENPAFEQIYWELVTNSEKAADFLTGIMPSAIRNGLGDNPKQEMLKRMNAFSESRQ
jgi:hypothetical protein